MSESTPTGTESTPAAETYDVDGDAYRCPHCERPFAVEQLRALHVGDEHPDAMSTADRDAYDAALDEESDELFVFHLKVVAAITVLLFVFIYTYAFVWAG